MTRDEILAEPAGIRLDSWVAEKVMGWKKWGVREDSHNGWTDNKGIWGHHLSTFSSNISAAWEVVEKTSETHKRAFTNELYGIMNPKREAFQIAPIDLIWYMNPLNICKAALLAVLEEVTT